MTVETELDPSGNNANRWEAHYLENDFPWDKGEATPVLIDLLARGDIALGRTLVVGCGRGHDAHSLAKADAMVTAIDVSPTAIKLARETYPGIDFQQQDLFDLPSTLLSQFDTVWEHTCYCAIHPKRRTDYANAIYQILKPGGQLMGAFFTLDHESTSGPPFKTTREHIRQMFSNFKELEASHPPRSFDSRKGQETLFRFRKPE